MYDIVKYTLDINNSMLYYRNVSKEIYDTEEQAKSVLSELMADGNGEYDRNTIPFYAISDLPSLKNNGVITMTFYASATLDNVTKGKVAEYAKNHRMDCHFI